MPPETPLDLSALFFRMTVATGLGLLVGLQRERATELAGLRTFALITLGGFLAGLLAMPFGGWVVGGGLLALAAVLVSGGMAIDGARRPGSPSDRGITTEVAALAMFGIGAYLAVGQAELGVVMGATVAVLLAFKGEIHRMAERLTEADVKAVMQFVLLSLIILPVLPDRTYDPFNVLNPRQIWWMVVLIVGVGLAGYIAGKFVPERASIAVSGLLGGLVSSTATTASYARRLSAGLVTPGVAAAVVSIAAGVSMARMITEVTVVAPGLLGAAGPALVTMAVAVLGVAKLVYRGSETKGGERTLANPSQVRGALLFAAIYAAVLLVSAGVKQRLGEGALYPVAVVSGLTDVDAITLTASRLFSTGSIEGGQAWRLIVTAALSNLAAKAAFAAFLGGRGLLMRLAPSFGASAAVGVAFLVFG